jgi:hypothetical protein
MCTISQEKTVMFIVTSCSWSPVPERHQIVSAPGNTAKNILRNFLQSKLNDSRHLTKHCTLMDMYTLNMGVKLLLIFMLHHHDIFLYGSVFTFRSFLQIFFVNKRDIFWRAFLLLLIFFCRYPFDFDTKLVLYIYRYTVLLIRSVRISIIFQNPDQGVL